MYLLEISIAICSFLVGMLSLYLTVYTKSKGKNRALKEDISKLEDEKQKIIAKYRDETEDLKKQHSLDIEKRKFKYEDKRTQFIKYFSAFDQFQNKSHKLFTEQFMPICSKYMAVCMKDDTEKQNFANIEFHNGLQSLFNELYKEQRKISNETNSIRLISSPDVNKLLDELESAVKMLTNQVSEMMNFIAKEEFMNDTTLIAPYQTEAEELGALVLQCRDKLRNQMKLELNEI